MSETLTVERLCQSAFIGEIVLPNFQRDFVWKSDDVRDLLVSILGGYYVGTMLVMDSTRADAPFDITLIPGVEHVNPKVAPRGIIKILLDGQQRTSSLFYSLHGPDMPLAGRKSPFRFYLNARKSLDEDWENSVEAINPTNKRQQSRIESDDNYISFLEFRDIGGLGRKILESPLMKEAQPLLNIANRFNNFAINTIELPRTTSLERVAETFSRINKKGLPLSTFDLLVAKLIKSDIRLRELLQSAQDRYLFLNEEEDIDTEFILRVICLMRGKEVRRKDILDLSADNFASDWEAACKALESAFKRITNQRNGFGAISFRRWAPFTTMIVPLAALIHDLRVRGADLAKNNDKIARWYWTSVFDNRYNEAVNTNTFYDLKAMKDWFADDSKEPAFIKNFDPEKTDLNVSNRTSAVYRGVLCLVMLSGARDFKTGDDPKDQISKLQDDHIFPKSHWKRDEIWNRTLISTNASKGDQHPSKYFGAAETFAGAEGLKQILDSHLIDDAGRLALLRDDVEGFRVARENVIKTHISRRVREEGRAATVVSA